MPHSLFAFGEAVVAIVFIGLFQVPGALVKISKVSVHLKLRRTQ